LSPRVSTKVKHQTLSGVLLLLHRRSHRRYRITALGALITMMALIIHMIYNGRHLLVLVFAMSAVFPALPFTLMPLSFCHRHICTPYGVILFYSSSATICRGSSEVMSSTSRLSNISRSTCQAALMRARALVSSTSSKSISCSIILSSK